MKFSADRKKRIGYLTAFVLLIISYLLVFVTTNILLKQTQKVNQSKENISNLEILFSSLKDVENNYQGYLISANPQSLFNFRKGKLRVASLINLIDFSCKHTVNFENLNKLSESTNQALKTFDAGINQFNDANKIVNDTIKNISYKGSSITYLIKGQIAYMQSLERDLIQKDVPATKSIFSILKIINFSSLIIAILIALYFMISYSKKNNVRRTTDDQTLVYRKLLEQRIEELNTNNKELKEVKSMEKFTATGRMARLIAHEVRNPLTNIGLANDQLKDGVEPNEENLMLMDMIKRNGERINHLLGDLLNATKFVELNLSKFAINDLLDEVLLMAKDRIDLSNTKIIKRYSHNMCDVLVDGDKIKIAFLNVILNSIEALIDDEGKIEIITCNSHNMCKVIFRDNGIGMNKEIVNMIFEPFFTIKHKGNGLGLTNAQNIILSHKGYINVTSEVGKGSDFIIKLNFA